MHGWIKFGHAARVSEKAILSIPFVALVILREGGKRERERERKGRKSSFRSEFDDELVDETVYV